MSIKRVRTRFAPSPTGPLHIGGARTALYCYLFAKKMKGDFILRIEDTDQGRFVPGAEEYIINALNWAGISPTEGQGIGGDYGPYRQSDRKHIYKQYADMLIEKGHAYYVFSSDDDWNEMKESLKKQGNPSPKYDTVNRQYLKNSLTLPAEEVSKRLANGDQYAIRYKMPRNEEVKFKDIIRGVVSFQTNDLDDKVLMKSDGMPTYHLANIVDDHLMEITHVIRGEEWLPSAPLHVSLYNSFGWDIPEFAHLPLILGDKGKLSKRDGDRLGFPVFPLNWENPETGEKSSGYKERGFLTEAFLNMLAFLGWNPGTDKEIFSLDELVESFSLERVGKSGAKYDFEKTKWFNQQYIKNKSGDELVELTKPFFQDFGYKFDDSYLSKVCDISKDRVTYIKEFPELSYYFFEDVKEFDEKMLSKKWSNENEDKFRLLTKNLIDLTQFSSENIETTVKDFMSETGLGFGQVLPILRISLTGTMQGPPIFDVMSLLGKEISNKRLIIGIEKAMSLK